MPPFAERGVAGILPVRDYVSAVSVGLVDDQLLLDLDYEEDSSAQVDMNVVMTGGGRFIEVQGTAKKLPFSRNLFEAMLDMAMKGMGLIKEKQREMVGELI